MPLIKLYNYNKFMWGSLDISLLRSASVQAIFLGLTFCVNGLSARVGILDAHFETLQIELPVLEGKFYTAERYSGVDMEQGKFSWNGKLKGSIPGFVSFGRVGNSISITLSFTAGLTYFYRGDFKDFAWIKKTSIGKKCGGCISDSSLPRDPRHRRSQPKSTWQNGDGNLIDLVFVYPEAVRTSAGSTATLEAAILAAVGDTNLCFRNSQINLIARMVHQEEVTYTPTGFLSTDLDRLIDKNDTYLDSVHSIRDQYGGDIVILLTTDSDRGGLASTLSYPHNDFESSAFNVTVWDQMGAPDYTLTHEIGHNMGCLHNIEDTSNITEYFVFSGFSYGKRWTSNGQGYRTVMSYDTDQDTYNQLIPYFSNPAVNYGTVATGNDGSADNAKVLTSTAPYVANFRQSIVQGIVASNYDVRVYEGNFHTSFGVRLAAKPNSSITVNISKSGDPDLFVGSPMSLIFNSSNWNLEQTVQILAKADTDSAEGTATLLLNSSAIPSSLTIPLTEFDSGTTSQSELYLTGEVKNSLGVGIEGVTITFSNSGGSTTTNSRGSFVQRMASGWSGDITPSKDNFNFSPAQVNISSLSVDQLATSFVGTQPNILYVNTSAIGTGDGSSWNNAFTDLGDALLSSIPHQEIWVAQGTYRPGVVRSSKFVIPPNTNLYGGFAGTETLRTQRHIQNNPTILSGDIGITNNGSDNSFHVVIPLQNSLLDGFTIKDGNASENFGDGDDRGKGGGLYADSTSFSVANCTFSNNNAKQGGAGIFLKDSNATFSSCSFISNSANSVGSGGALLIEDSNVSFSASSFLNNSSAYQGGAIKYTNSEGSITDSNFTQNLNTLANGGGAIYLDNSPINFGNCTFLENSTQANNHGGAVKLSASSANFSNCLFTRNSSPLNSAGAIYVDSSSSPTFSGNEFHYNSSGQFGGAILTESSIIFVGGIFLGNYANYGGGFANQGSINVSFEKVMILGNEANTSSSSNGGFAYFGGSGANTLFVNCMISGNKSTYRNGVFRGNGSNRFVNCSIVGNQSGNEGGVALLQSGDSVAIENSIIWDNTSLSSGNDFFVNTQSISANHSIFDPSQSTENISGTNNQNINPGLIDANGTDNLYGSLDDDFSLSNTSPAINAGSDGVANYQPTDIIGNSRLGLPEIGAFEFLSNTLPVITSGANQTTFENTSLILQVSATDINGDTLIYSITGGTDQSLFSIKSDTGELNFLSSPDFENPLDSGTDNIYNVQVSVSDGVGSVLLDLQVVVTKDPSTVFTVSGGQGSSPYYVFTDGNGQTPNFSTQSLYLGETYTFTATGISGSHPFMIGESYGDMDSSLVSGGPLTGTGGSISVSIPSGFSGTLNYFCTNHSGMNDSFNVQSPPHIVELNASLNLTMLWVEPGSFTMGTPTSEGSRGADENETQVSLSRGFYLGKYEVTQAEYEFVMTGNPDGIDATPNYFPGHSDRPVEGVKYGDIQVFIQRLNEQMASTIPAGWAYVLPTEAQWEYACRAGTNTAYSWGGSIASNDANYNWDGNYNTGSDYQQTRDVGQYSPNAWGFYDMHGNVREWVTDWYGEYAVGPLTDPTGVTSGSNRVIRGGAWWDAAIYLRSGARYSADLNYVNGGVGFRIAFQNLNTLPVFVTDSNQTIYENTTLLQVSATDANGNTLVYSISGGADQSKFSIHSDTGELSFVTAPDFENPLDSGTDNIYHVQVSVSDGVGSVLLDLQVVVTKDPSTVFTVSGGQGSSPYYVFTDGNGQTPNFSTQSLYLGETYTFTASGISGSHPFMIGESYGDMDSSLVSGGPLTGTGGSISVSIPSGFSGTLNYFCTNHSGMNDSFNVQSPPHIVELNASLNLTMLWVEPGSFTMGTPTSEGSRGADENETQVSLSRGFYLGKYEVTQAEYEFVMTGNPDGIDATPNYFPGHSDRPVEGVKYGDIQVFIQRLNEQMASTIPAGWAYVLPTEAQWEYACRAGTNTAYSWGGSIASNDANYNWDGNYNTGSDYQQTRDVGQYSPNAWGFYDMHGNVREWVTDWYGEYAVGPLTDPTGVTSGSNRVIRGGAWWDAAIYLRSGARYSADLNYVNGGVGFRIAFQNLNNAPTNLGPISVLSVEENQPIGTVVGEFNSSDPNGNSISYFLVSGQGDENNTLFTLEENGTLKTSTTLDYELSYLVLSIRVQARDEFNATTDGNFSVLLLDLDDTVPVLFLVGSPSITLEVGSLFHDQNATRTDNIDGNGTVSGTGSVNPNALGSYVLNYNYTDTSGNAAITITRTVTVVDTTAPVLTIIGDENITHEAGLAYTDANASWIDHVDGSGMVTASGSVNINTPGSY
ncbi:SUMF1/EgtB/PvdO family nonheme iron enzyme, partial [Opitutales bacterium]|nr:SUMF1/EgtB/PvdO family nonheme iron enzyme [Opitutales bacterium]